MQCDREAPRLLRRNPVSKQIRTLVYRIAYDGSCFHGMQIQPRQKTIQGEIEKVLGKIVRSELRIRYAGRTDTGVHATCQVIAVDIPNPIPVPALRNLANAKLGGAIVLGDGWEGIPNFQPRYRARLREYTYIFAEQEALVDPFRKGKITFVKPGLDWDAALEFASHLLGDHNYRAFCSKPDQEERLERSLDTVEIHSHGSYQVIRIVGQSFLRGMVRHIVGGMLRVARGRWVPEDALRLLELGRSGKKDDSLIPAAPDGLYLTDVTYPEGQPGTEFFPAGTIDQRIPFWLREACKTCLTKK